jgi:hypothetical protein
MEALEQAQSLLGIEAEGENWLWLRLVLKSFILRVSIRWRLFLRR